jgi:hypothetical protein
VSGIREIQEIGFSFYNDLISWELSRVAKKLHLFLLRVVCPKSNPLSTRFYLLKVHSPHHYHTKEQTSNPWKL